MDLILLGILAGALIACGGVVANTASFQASPSIGRLISGLLFPFGLGMVILTGAELFTGNSLISISLFEKKCTVKGMLRNWIIVYLANLLGAVLVAAACAYFGQLDLAGGELANHTIKVAANKCSISFGSAIVLGFFCNVLVCLGVLLAMTTKETPGRIMGAYLPVCFFVICGFEHCVANMYYIPAGLMAMGRACYADLPAVADAAGRLTMSGFIFGNLLPVTIGNVLGGVAVGFVMWYCYLRKKS